ncbi:putative aaa atpase [Anaeramoeba flamelloides]|uniref:Aaa atpase n=1 Tax=Anaeramoeba flamelloides TaxID=1746091 RepID=A0AAV7ZUZ1_9EUKA|nr:putative aaa atpase [Anaeramoeba flamelloides]
MNDPFVSKNNVVTTSRSPTNKTCDLKQFSYKRQRLQSPKTISPQTQRLFYKPGGLNVQSNSTQRELDRPKYGRLYSLYGNRSFVPIYKLPFFFGSHPKLSFMLYGQEGEFSRSLSNISLDAVTRNRYLRVTGQEGKVYLNGNILVKGHKILLKDGDNLEFIGDQGKRYSFVFLSELFINKTQENLKKSGSFEKQFSKFNQKNPKINKFSSRELRYLKRKEIKKQFCNQLLISQVENLIEKRSLNENKAIQFEKYLPQNLLKLLKMFIKLNFNSGLTFKSLEKNKPNFNNTQNDNLRKYFFVGKKNCTIIQEKICKYLSKEFNFQFFTFNLLEFLPLLPLFRTFEKKYNSNTNKEKDKEKEKEEEEENDTKKGNEEEKEKEKEEENVCKKEKEKEHSKEKEFSIGERIMYIGPDFQKIDSDRLIRSLLHNSQQKSKQNKQNSTLLSGPKPGAFGKVIMSFPTEFCYSSPYLAIEFDDPLPNVGCDLGLKSKRNCYFVKKSEILKLDDKLNQELPIILCKQFFNLLKKCGRPFLLFIPNIDKSVLHSYHILETIKFEIDNLIRNNPNAFIFSGIETGEHKLTKLESTHILKSIRKYQQEKFQLLNNSRKLLIKQVNNNNDDTSNNNNSDVNKNNNNNKNRNINNSSSSGNNNNNNNNNDKSNGNDEKTKIIINKNIQKNFFKKIIDAREKRLINFFTQYFGQLIFIKKPTNQKKKKIWQNFIKIEKKFNIQQQNKLLLNFQCKNLKSIDLNSIFLNKNCNLFTNNIYTPKEMDCIIGYSITHSVKNNFNKTINLNIDLNKNDLIYGLNLFNNTKLNQKANNGNKNGNGNGKENENENGNGNENEDEDVDVDNKNNRKIKFKNFSNLEKLIYRQANVALDHLKVKFENIGGMNNIKDKLFEDLIQPFNRPELYQRGNLKSNNFFKGVLLYGPSGSGKTMIAKSIANEISKDQKNKITLLKITPSLIYSKWYGNAEKNVQAIFSLAKKCSPSILFIDQVDSLLSKRTNIQMENETNRKIKNLFMQFCDSLNVNQNNTEIMKTNINSQNNCEIENLKLDINDINDINDEDHVNNDHFDKKKIIIIGSTNRPYDLDDAIIRRFNKKYYIPLPNYEQRFQILKILLQKEKLESNFNFNKLAKLTENYSGSDLKNLVNVALYGPIYDQLELEKKQKMENNLKFSLRELQFLDFEKKLTTIKSSLAPDSLNIKKLLKWNYFYHGTDTNLQINSDNSFNNYI